jgi:hypothetical protein
MGAEVILACRNLEKAKKVQEIIEQETKVLFDSYLKEF